MVTNLDEIKNLNAKEMAEFLEMVSPLGDGLSFYHYINETLCNSKYCPLTKKPCCVVKTGRACPFTYRQKIERFLLSKSISKAKYILGSRD